MGKLRAIDLFCGTGGFSRGAHDAGFDVVAAYDLDPILTSSFSRNFPKTKLVLADVAKLTAADVRKVAGKGDIDLIFGGPPCQGFSTMGRRDAADPRRRLLGQFFRLVAEIEPAAFVMENVLGLAYSDAKAELDAAMALIPAKYTVIGPVALNAADFGAATARKRLFVIGYDPSRCAPFDVRDIEQAKSAKTTVAEALSGLDNPMPVTADDLEDVWRMPANIDLSPYALGMASNDRRFTGNQRTVHTKAVVERFAALPQGGTDPIGKYPRLSSTGLCPTLRAGTGSDKGSHQSIRPVHPTQNRVITVREAARLQGFPDEHYFHPTIWHSFRMIGNSVSPIMAKAVLSVIRENISAKASLKRQAA